MNKYISRQNHLNRKKNWTSSFPERVNPALVCPTIDHARTAGECNSAIGRGARRGFPRSSAFSRSSAVCARRTSACVALRTQVQANVTFSRARARADTYTYIRTYARWDVPARPYELDESYTHTRGWHR